MYFYLFKTLPLPGYNALFFWILFENSIKMAKIYKNARQNSIKMAKIYKQKIKNSIKIIEKVKKLRKILKILSLNGNRTPAAWTRIQRRAFLYNLAILIEFRQAFL